MNDEFHILIADRNRHVREFLQRELKADGYRVQVARDGREVLLTLNSEQPPDLLILDLDIPYEGWPDLLKQIRRCTPAIPVVIHTLLTEYAGHPDLQDTAAFLEKSGNTDTLKKAVRDVLMIYYGKRWGGNTRAPQALREDSEELE
jgi:DNA-binding NtrC family response regulator